MPEADILRGRSRQGGRLSRILEGSGIPLHKDNQTIVKERISLDSNADKLLDPAMED